METSIPPSIPDRSSTIDTMPEPAAAVETSAPPAAASPEGVEQKTELPEEPIATGSTTQPPPVPTSSDVPASAAPPAKAEVKLLIEAAPSSSGPLPDPTDELATQAWRPRFTNLAAAAHRYADHAARAGAVVITSALPELARQAAVHVLMDSQFDIRRRRVWDLDSSPGTLHENIRAGAFFRHLGSRDRDRDLGTDGAIVMVYITTAEALDELRACAGPVFDNPAWLQERIGIVICIGGNVVADPRHASFLARRERWHLDTLPELLHDQGADGDDMIRLVAELEQSWQARHWGDDYQTFLETVDLIIVRKGLDGLRIELDNRGADRRDGAAARVAAMLDRANTVEQAALFIATHFRDIGVHWFRRLVGVLTDGESVASPESSTEMPKIVTPLQYWDQRARPIMKSLALRFSQSPDDGIRIGFEDPTIAQLFHTEMAAAAERYFERLQQQNLIFDPDVQSALDPAILDLAARMVELDPVAYDGRWILRSFLASAGATPKPGSTRITVPADADEAVVAGTARLCRRFFTEERTTRIANDFLRRLVETTQPSVGAVLRLVLTMHGVSGLDALGLGKQMLEVTSSEGGRKVTSWLVGQLRGDADEQWAFVERLTSWLPPTEAGEPRDVSGSQRWSLAFPYMLYEHAQHQRARWMRSKRGSWPTHIFGPELPTALTTTRRTLLADWLRHPAFVPALDGIVQEIKGDVVYGHLCTLLPGDALPAELCRAEILEFLNLVGSHDVVAPLAIEVSNSLPRPEAARLRALLRWRAEILSAELAVAERDERTRLRDHRRSILDLCSSLARARGKDSK